MDTKHPDIGAGPAASRRTFLQMAGGWMLAGLGLRLSSVSAAPVAEGTPGTRRGSTASKPAPPSIGRATMPDQMDRETFTLHEGSAFTFSAAERAVELTLLDVQDRRTPLARASASGECFSLWFQGPIEVALEQGTYPVVHGRLGSFDMFIVPTGADARGRYYEALFNRMTG